MASTNKTSNYELNQWVKTDPVLMDDFNADNEKIDAAMAEISAKIPKIVLGSYVGTGEFGHSKPCTLTFDFKPLFICMGDGYTLSRGQSSFVLAGDNCVFSWGENSISWYATGNSVQQMNVEGFEYHYMVIG